MKNLIPTTGILFLLSIIGLNIAFNSILAAIGLAMVIFGLFFLGRSHVLENRKVKRVGNRYDDFYLVQLPPSGKWYYEAFPPELIVFAKKGQMEKTRNAIADLIQRSGNNMDLQIVCFFFQSGILINENESEYEDRVVAEIKKLRSANHQMMSKDRKFYNENHLKESSSFEWEI